MRWRNDALRQHGQQMAAVTWRYFGLRKEPPALQELQQHPEIRTIELRLDNDSPGRMTPTFRKSTLTTINAGFTALQRAGIT